MATATTAIPGIRDTPRAPSWDRLVLVPLESRRSRLLVLGLTLALAAALAASVARPAVAWYLARRDTVAALEAAVRWDPFDPALHTRLGQAYAMLVPPDAARARAHFDAAVRLRPTDAYPRLLLALLLARRQDREGARRALAEALRLDPHNVTVRWEAALLHLGWGEREPALAHLKYVLAVDPAQRDAAFQLARTLLGAGEDPAGLLPAGADGLTSVLVAALDHRDLALAGAAWSRRARLEPAVPVEVARRYLDLLLEAGDVAAARRVWRAVAGDRGAADGEAVWNGGFETERLQGWGLDWRVRKRWGVDVALDRFVAARGSRSLRLVFNSFPTLDFDDVTQLVPVEPGRPYRLRALARATDFTTQSGLKLQVVVPGSMERLLGETPAVSGTTRDWVPLEARVTIPPGTSLVLLRVRREPAPGPEGNLGGKVWLDEVSLR